MRKILGLLIFVALLVATSCEKENNKETAIISAPAYFALIDSEGNNVLENEPEAIYDVEIIYNDETFVFDDNAYHGNINDIEIMTDDCFPGAFFIHGNILIWGSTTDFTLKFRGESFDISIVAIDEYRGLDLHDWHKATVDGKTCEPIRLAIDLEVVNDLGISIDNNPTEAYFLAFPIYIK